VKSDALGGVGRSPFFLERKEDPGRFSWGPSRKFKRGERMDWPEAVSDLAKALTVVGVIWGIMWGLTC